MKQFPSCLTLSSLCPLCFFVDTTTHVQGWRKYIATICSCKLGHMEAQLAFDVAFHIAGHLHENFLIWMLLNPQW
jgi:hypothetical protein